MAGLVLSPRARLLSLALSASVLAGCGCDLGIRPLGEDPTTWPLISALRAYGGRDGALLPVNTWVANDELRRQAEAYAAALLAPEVDRRWGLACADEGVDAARRRVCVGSYPVNQLQSGTVIGGCHRLGTMNVEIRLSHPPSADSVVAARSRFER